MARLFMLLATGFGVGYLPKAPGTWGSLLALPLYLVLAPLPMATYLLVMVFCIALAVACAGAAEKIIDHKDPSIVVIDEIVGMLVALIGCPGNMFSLLAVFGLFRLFDVWKPFPVCWFDRHLNGGVGIVADDVAAGLLALMAATAIRMIG